MAPPSFGRFQQQSSLRPQLQPQPPERLVPHPPQQQHSRMISRMIQRQPQSLPLFHMLSSPHLMFSGLLYDAGWGMAAWPTPFFPKSSVYAGKDR